VRAARYHERKNARSSQASRSALAAPQGEERPATSKTRRRRSGTSGTRIIVLTPPSEEASARSVASPPTRRTLVAARSSLATHPGAFGPSSCLSRRSQFTPQCSDRRAARQPTAWPSARPTGAVAAPTPAHDMCPAIRIGVPAFIGASQACRRCMLMPIMRPALLLFLVFCASISIGDTVFEPLRFKSTIWDTSSESTRGCLGELEITSNRIVWHDTEFCWTRADVSHPLTAIEWISYNRWSSRIEAEATIKFASRKYPIKFLLPGTVSLKLLRHLARVSPATRQHCGENELVKNATSGLFEAKRTAVPCNSWLAD
jgi:hypothetical protein